MLLSAFKRYSIALSDRLLPQRLLMPNSQAESLHFGSANFGRGRSTPRVLAFARNVLRADIHRGRKHSHEAAFMATDIGILPVSQPGTALHREPTLGVLSRQATEKQTDESDVDPFFVAWEGPEYVAFEFDSHHFDNPYLSDSSCPWNFSKRRRWWLTAVVSVITINPAFSSTAPAGVAREMQEYFGFGKDVSNLVISLFVAGYCFGPIVFGPLSERIGRRPVFFWSYLVYTAFSVGAALSKTTGQILVFRFLMGVFASAPQSVAAAVMGDLHRADVRAIAISLFVLAPFAVNFASNSVNLRFREKRADN